ncbi:hypothetical protein DdX_14796 [Ditylenchus destructor]|uniref:Uncharacterized protein n=1 Tax=Ditylenchus destructor TaxID=166010 RepID=A0AAD4QYB2_9BILA|nr:hypothetical protein DdX_14796 [Ditylenchus destructor]
MLFSEYPPATHSIPRGSYTHLRLRKHPRRRSSAIVFNEDEEAFARKRICELSGFLCSKDDMSPFVPTFSSASSAICGVSTRWANLTLIHLQQDHIMPVLRWAERSASSCDAESPEMSEDGARSLFVPQFRVESSDVKPYIHKPGHTENCGLCISSAAAMTKMIEASEQLAGGYAVHLCEQGAKLLPNPDKSKKKCSDMNEMLIKPTFALVKSLLDEDVLCRIASAQCIENEKADFFYSHTVDQMTVPSCDLCQLILNKGILLHELVLKGTSVITGMLCTANKQGECDFVSTFLTNTANLLVQHLHPDTASECRRLKCWEPPNQPTECYKPHMGFVICDELLCQNAVLVKCDLLQGRLRTRNKCKGTDGQMHTCATLHCRPRGANFANVFMCENAPEKV